MIKVNRTKAEAVIKDRLRVQRASRFETLDTEFIKALEVGSDTAHVAEQKQALRDVTKKDLSVLGLDELASLNLDEALKLKE